MLRGRGGAPEKFLQLLRALRVPENAEVFKGRVRRLSAAAAESTDDRARVSFMILLFCRAEDTRAGEGFYTLQNFRLNHPEPAGSLIAPSSSSKGDWTGSATCTENFRISMTS